MPTLEKPCIKVWDAWLCNQYGQEDWIEVVEWNQPRPARGSFRIETLLEFSADVARAKVEAKRNDIKEAIHKLTSL